jgi:hypothetical protein
MSSTEEVPTASGLLATILNFPDITLESYVRCSCIESGNSAVPLKVYVIVIYVRHGA